jgi:hypothetical protein
MMLKLLFVSALFTMVSCATTTSYVINNSDLSKVDFSKVANAKTGKSCAKWYFIFGPFGDRSLVNAAKNGGISRVDVVDYSIENGFFTHSRCIVAYGE